jgi:hypothetical protein
MNEEVAMGLLVKIVRADFAEFHLDDGMEEDKTLFAIDTGWFEVTREETALLEELTGRFRKPPEPFVESREG